MIRVKIFGQLSLQNAVSALGAPTAILYVNLNGYVNKAVAFYPDKIIFVEFVNEPTAFFLSAFPSAQEVVFDIEVII